MRFRYGVSRAAIILAATGLAAAQAQTATITPCDVNVRTLLAPFLSLNASAIGRATLQDNLAQTIAVNDRSTPDQRALAISGQVRPGAAPYLGALTLVDGSVVKLGPADNLAGRLPLQAI
jgi:subtilase-type serine protease